MEKKYKTIKGLYKAYTANRITREEMERQLLLLYISNNDMVNTDESFKLFDSVNGTLFIDKNDVIEFNELPSIVTLYRGQNTEDLDGISWTTDFEIAKKFAARHKLTINDEDGECIEAGVLKVEVPKEQIKAYTNNRNEKECIITESNDSEWVLTF